MQTRFVMINNDFVIGIAKKKLKSTKGERIWLSNGEDEYGYNIRGFKFSPINKQESYGEICEVGDIL